MAKMKLYIAHFQNQYSGQEHIVIFDRYPDKSDTDEYEDNECPLNQVVSCSVLEGNVLSLPLGRVLIEE
jgi:hypothetical protein